MKWMLLSLYIFASFSVFTQPALSPVLIRSAASRVNENKTDTFSITVRQLQSFMEIQSPQMEILSVHAPSHSIQIRSSWSFVMDSLLTSPNVQFIDKHQAPHEESVLDKPNFGINRIRKVQHDYPDLSGQDRIISIKELQFKTVDIDIRGKQIFLGLEASSTSDHATDMATIISGRGNTSPLLTGAMPNALLSSSDYANLLPDDEGLLLQHDIYLQNHSYGVGIENYYGTEAVAYDLQVYQHPQILHIFSSGNSGTLAPEDGTYAAMSFANLTGNFKQAKNVLTVTALDTTFSVSSYNSRGPAYDGRIKPELTAYGGSGTSEAAAIISGISGILQEACKKRLATAANASFIKALLIAGADDTGPTGIDFYTGYGNVNASKSLKILDNEWFAEVPVEKGEKKTLTLQIPDSISLLTLAVVWTDPPAVVNAETALVDDIDSYISYGSDTWRPWCLNSSPTKEALETQAVRQADHLNNVEYITIKSPDKGSYTLTLDGANISSSTQLVSVAWSLLKQNEFSWDYPSGSDLLPAKSKIDLFWTDETGATGDLLWQIEGGEWQLIANGISSRHYKWMVPDTSGFIRLRWITSDGVHDSEPFLISRQTEMQIAYNCDTAFALQWTSIPEAIAYNIHEMHDNTMKVMDITTDTIRSISKIDEYFYSVSPVFESNEEGLRALAINYSTQGALCYINLFAAELLESEQIQLTLNLSTPLGIEKIDLLKSESGSESEILMEFNPKEQSNFTLLDSSTTTGLIRYQAILYFDNDSFLPSEMAEVYVPDIHRAIVYPNPTRGAYIHVLSSDYGQLFQILDQTGRELLNWQLTNTLETITLPTLPSGVYYYRIVKNGTVHDTGKFIKY